jgi:hypothetical protein
MADFPTPKSSLRILQEAGLDDEQIRDVMLGFSQLHYGTTNYDDGSVKSREGYETVIQRSTPMPRNIDDARRYFSPERKIIRSMPDASLPVPFTSPRAPEDRLTPEGYVDGTMLRQYAGPRATYASRLRIPEGRAQFLQEKRNLEDAIRRGNEALMQNPNNDQLRQSVEEGKKRLMELIDSDLMPSMPMPEER